MAGCSKCRNGRVTCDPCKGKGYYEKLKETTCNKCRGTDNCAQCRGRAQCGVCGGRNARSCNACRGTGACQTCKGSGHCQFCVRGKSQKWEQYDCNKCSGEGKTRCRYCNR